jgi:hypothetical protein
MAPIIASITSARGLLVSPRNSSKNCKTMESLIKCSIIDWICNLKEATQIYSMLKWKMQVKKTMKISEIQEEIY